MPSRRSSHRKISPELAPPCASNTGLRIFEGLSLFMAVQGMVILYGGTRFWASGPFFGVQLLICAVAGGVTYVLAKREPGTLHLSVEALGLFGGAVFCAARALTDSPVPYETWSEAYLLICAGLLWLSFVRLGASKHAWLLLSLGMLTCAMLHSMSAMQLHVLDLRNVLWLQRPEQYGMRASGTFFCPNHFGHYLQMAMILAVGLLCTPRMRLSVRIFAAYCLCLMTPVLILTLSRAAILGTLAGIAVVVALILIRKKSWILFALGGVFALLVAAAGALLYGTYEPFRERFRDFGTNNIRMTMLWPDTWSMIKGEGFWGSGPGTFPHVFDGYRDKFNLANLYMEHSHNEYLDLLAEYGWLATGALLLIAVWVCVRLARASLRMEDLRTALLPAMMLGIWVATLVQAVFDFHLHITANSMVTVMLLATFHGAVAARGGWGTTWSLSPATSRAILLVAALGCCALLPYTLQLSMGSYHAYQARLAAERKDADRVSFHSLRQRVWLPGRYDGWRILGQEKRARAFWMRDPVRKQELIQESREAYEHAILLNPYDRISYAGQVELLKMENDWEEALTAVDRLMDLAPLDVQVRIQKGLILRRMGRDEEALAVFQEAKRMRRRKDRQIQANLNILRRRLRDAKN